MSKKNVDQKGRFRNKIISFRVSEEEAKLLKRRVLLSGLTKQDYIINSIPSTKAFIGSSFRNNAYRNCNYSGINCTCVSA